MFYVDVGNIPPQDIEQFMQKFITSMKRNQVVDPSTGQVDLRYNPMSVEEDYYIPVRGGVQTKIETLTGGKNATDIDDVKYLRDKMFSGLKIPQAYLTYGEGAQEDKGTLAQKDIRFARTIDRLQRCILSELEKVAMIHLYVLGFRGEDLLSFKLKLNNPSKIAEMQELEHWKTKFDVVTSVPEGYFSKRWIATSILEVSDEEYLRNQRELFYDKHVAQELEYVGQEVATSAASGGGGGFGLGGEETGMPAAEGGAEGIPGAEAPGGTDVPEGEAAGGDTALLAAPGMEPPPPPTAAAPEAMKQDDKQNIKFVDARTGATTTTASKGKWHMKSDDDRRDDGAKRRHIKALGAKPETATMPKRQVFHGMPASAKALLGLSKGIFENETTNYEEEENKLFETQESVRKLFEDLEHLDE